MSYPHDDSIPNPIDDLQLRLMATNPALPKSVRRALYETLMLRRKVKNLEDALENLADWVQKLEERLLL